MVERGVARFRTQQDAATETRAHETSAGSRLLKSYVLQISDQISLYLNREHPDRKWNRMSPAAKLLQAVDPDKAAMFALREVINCLFSHDRVSIQSVCVNIGSAIEDELRLMKFQTEYKEYYDSLIRDFERKRTTSYKHKRRVLTNKGTDQGLVWQDWTRDDQFGVGSLVLSLLMEVCDLVEKQRLKKKTKGFDVVLAPTDECLKWINDHDTVMELLSPDRMPCIIPPADWINHEDGGYYSARLRHRTPLVKSRSKDKTRERLLQEAEMPRVLASVNTAQRTAWQVNTRILDVMQRVWSNNLGCGMPRSEPYEIPPCPLSEDQVAKELDEDSDDYRAFCDWKAAAREIHTIERERVAKNLALVRTLRLARELAERERFWYVYQLDFRGRMYCATAGLSPQGTDHSKSLLRFARGKALGDALGEFWFVINGANKLGFDKDDFDARHDHMLDRWEEWCAIAADPIANTGWTSADKPYQFLAWCFEFFDWYELRVAGRGHEFVSHLPVGMDGSCNGLQHFSAMLRDEVGGKEVNLVPGPKPADVYQTVANVCFDKVIEKAALGEGGAVNWKNQLGTSMSRKLAKTPVMTLPYGSTQQACTASIYKWAVDNVEFPKNTMFRHSLYLNPLLWTSISEVVIAARAAMDWLRDCAVVITKDGSPISYKTPLGFPVHQVNRKYTTRRIATQIGGRLDLRLATDTHEYDSRKQRQGLPPNFVHSADGTHMAMAVTETAKACDTDFALIHDDFGVHACDTEFFRGVIQKTFVELHTEHDMMQDFIDAHAAHELPPMPEKGTLDLNQVLESPYFFG